jgi:hypothetical protein
MGTLSLEHTLMPTSRAAADGLLRRDVSVAARLEAA